MATKTAEKKEFTLKQVFAMWKRTSQKGSAYFTGKDEEGNNLRGFYNTNKQNPKEPDVKIYTVDENGDRSKDVYISLWCNAKDNGKKYLSGKIDGKRVVGFINARATEENKQPYFSVYWSDQEEETKPAEEKKSTRQQKQKEEPKFEEVKTDDDLPF